MTRPDLVARLRDAISYSHNFATAKPNILALEKEHILGLCMIAGEAANALEARGEADAAYKDGYDTGRMHANEPRSAESLAKELAERFPLLAIVRALDKAAPGFAGSYLKPKDTTPQPGDGWRPIAEAPKDGVTEILLYGHRHMFIGVRPIGCPDDAAADMLGTACYPTHFQPLPAAPAQGGAG